MPAESPTVVVQLTATGRAAVATIRLEGPQALAMLTRLFTPRGQRCVADDEVGAIRYGRWRSPLGEQVVVCRRGEDAWEIHCHGGVAAPAAILESLVESGAQAVEWRSWLEQTTPDPIAVEAQVALAHAGTERAAAILLDQYHGALRRACAQIAELVDRGEQAPALAQLDGLLSRAEVGRRLANAFRVVLAGPPNVGKSSLLNALLGYQRAIVFDEPGTTRDVVSAPSAVAGWPVEFADTAGFRQAADALEQAGIERAQAAAADADLV
jgi:tRNA modification GTPase